MASRCEESPLLPELSLFGPSSVRCMGMKSLLLAMVVGIAALGVTTRYGLRHWGSRHASGVTSLILADHGPSLPKFDVWYVNVDKEKARDACMRKQLTHAGLVPHRYKADCFGTCGEQETFVKCLQQQGFGDCVQGGIDWPAVGVHGTNRNSSFEVSNHIISNWCSHKRLFSQLAEAADDVRFFLILEDDAVIDYSTLKPELESFLQAYQSVDWDLVVVDPIYSQVSVETHNRLTGDMCDAHEVGQHHGKPVWQVPPLDSSDPGNDTRTRSCKVANCSFCGAQALLVQKPTLRRLVSIMEGIPAIPLDWLPRHVPKALAWRPKVAMNTVGLNRSAPSFCSEEVLESSIEQKFTAVSNLAEKSSAQGSSKTVEVQSKFAFVQIAFDPPSVAPGTYLWPVLPMARALQRLGSRYPLVLLTNDSRLPDGSDVAEAMRKLNCYVLPVHEVPLPDAVRSSFRRAYWEFAWLKLQVWGLTQFEKLIWMDSDAILFRNIDYMFQLEGTWMQRDNWDCKNDFMGNKECSGLVLLQPSLDTYAGLLQYSSTNLQNDVFGDQSVIAGYFRDVVETPVRLFAHIDAAFGHCIGRLPGIPYQDANGSLVEGIWGTPAFVHKSSRMNECFGLNLSAQHLVTNGTTLNICDYHPLGPWWRQLFCEAVQMSGATSASASSFCSLFPSSLGIPF